MIFFSKVGAIVYVYGNSKCVSCFYALENQKNLYYKMLFARARLFEKFKGVVRGLERTGLFPFLVRMKSTSGVYQNRRLQQRSGANLQRCALRWTISRERILKISYQQEFPVATSIG